VKKTSEQPGLEFQQPPIADPILEPWMGHFLAQASLEVPMKRLRPSLVRLRDCLKT